MINVKKYIVSSALALFFTTTLNAQVGLNYDFNVQDPGCIFVHDEYIHGHRGSLTLGRDRDFETKLGEWCSGYYPQLGRYLA